MPRTPGEPTIALSLRLKVADHDRLRELTEAYHLASLTECITALIRSAQIVKEEKTK